MEENYYGIMGRRSRFYSTLFFIIGLIAAIGLRLVLIINKLSAILASIIWYLAVVFYIVFYFYRYHIEQKRREILISNRLRSKLNSGEHLNEADMRNLKKVIDSIMVSKQNINLIILIVISVISLAIQITLDFLI